MKSFDVYIAWLELDFAFYELNKALKKMYDEMEAMIFCLHSFCEAWKEIKSQEDQ